MKQLIRQILKEETENKKINSIVKMIRLLFNDVVVDIEVDELDKKPLIRVQIKTDDPAVNINNWYAQQMIDTISDYTGGDFRLMPWWASFRRNEVFDAYLDVYRKRYDDEGNALKESRRPIKQPRAEDFEKYKDILDEIVYQFVPSDTTKCKKEIKESKDEKNYLPVIKKLVEPFKNEDCVCDISVWYDEEDDMYSVYLVLGNEELNDKFYYVDGIRTYRNKLANKIKTEIKSYLPIDNLYVGSYGKPNCGWKPLKESKDDIQKNLSAIRDMLKTISWDGLCDMWVEYNKDDGEYEIRSKTTNRDREFDEDLSFLDRTLRSMGLRVFIFAPWFVENCEDEVEFLN